jgi:hypothetical protein
MCLPFLNLLVWYDALLYMSSNLLRGWCVAYVGDASVSDIPMTTNNIPTSNCIRATDPFY